MIIFIKQKKSIKTEDNFQKKKSIYNTIKPLKQQKSIKDDHNNQQSQITS